MSFSIKLHAIAGKAAEAPGYDFRGGEPQDEHRTLWEIDPLDDSEFDEYQGYVEAANGLIAKGVPSSDLATVQFRLMDSDGRK